MYYAMYHYVLGYIRIPVHGYQPVYVCENLICHNISFTGENTLSTIDDEVYCLYI